MSYKKSIQPQMNADERELKTRILRRGYVVGQDKRFIRVHPRSFAAGCCFTRPGYFA